MVIIGEIVHKLESGIDILSFCKILKCIVIYLTERKITADCFQTIEVDMNSVQSCLYAIEILKAINILLQSFLSMTYSMAIELILH